MVLGEAVKDLTLLYYTANLVEEPFATNIRNHVVSLFPDGIPIISVSHKSIDFGKNIVVNEFEYCIYNIYRQILIGTRQAKTKYVACIEDDALYTIDHFSFRPPDDTFAYNVNRWQVNPSLFFYRERINMCMCIAPTELMLKTLELRFQKYPIPLPKEKTKGFVEPGKGELIIGLPPVKLMTFKSANPTLTFNHRPSLGGVRRLMARDILQQELPTWGYANDLWKKMYDGDGT